MTDILPYARVGPRRRSKLLPLLATVTLAYPLLVVLLLYGEWLLASLALGHPPRPSMDDPKSISGSSWLHPAAGLALLGFLPMAGAALALNVTHLVVNRPSPVRATARLAALVVLWVGFFLLLRLDPLQVVYWWFD